MDYNQPTGGLPGDPYIGKNVAAGIQGSKVPPHAIEYPQREIINVITAALITPSNGDLTQLLQALRRLFTYGSQRVNTYTSSTTFVVPATVYGIFIEAWGAGGGGGSGNGTSQGGFGGGGGQYSAGAYPVTPGETLTITIGAGGAGTASAGNAGVPGGSSAVVGSASGTLLSAAGGSGGPTFSNAGAAAGGTGGSGFKYQITGGGSFVIGAGTSGLSGGSVGGASPLGGYGGQPGNSGGSPGGGASGNNAVNTYTAGNITGANGQVRLTFVQ